MFSFCWRIYAPTSSPLGCLCSGSEIWNFLWSGGNIVPSLLTATCLQRTQRGPKWGSIPALTSFPGRFPEKMGGAGNALLQYHYLTFYIGSHLSITDTKAVRDTRSWLQYCSRTLRVSSGLTHVPARYHISGCAESLYSYTICQTLPFIQWLPLPLTLLKTLFSGDRKWSWI